MIRVHTYTHTHTQTYLPNILEEPRYADSNTNTLGRFREQKSPSPQRPMTRYPPCVPQFFIIVKLILLHDSLLRSIKFFGKVAQPGTPYALVQFSPLFWCKLMEELQLSV